MFRYSVFILFCICFCACSCSGLSAADKTDDALLLKLDKMIEQREVYRHKK